ncbi:hypothetical protein DFP72DRAFT_906906 [Ephemerocybe angulata]|uniref:Uncharacterized protein n=1 Tax=Ephemerocybe angulata TaxID=980116 RepID=A0A8H6HS64_9AGAR|nr:hypothetical protein DFP72DRAFT_906906 [Tulosesus angulatus]
MANQYRGGSNASIRSRKSATGSDPNRIRPPSHRHAAPSAPWPWVDIGDGMLSNAVDPEQLASSAPPIPELCAHDGCSCWGGYPQSRFPNWTKRQVKKSKIWDAIWSYDRSKACTIYRCDVDTNGFFTDAGVLPAVDGKDDETWTRIIDESRQRPDNVRIRALFVENMSGPVLRMLGARYNIEPFFFSSSLNWIPSRFQEEIQDNIGDHITVTLTFIKSMKESDFNDYMQSASVQDDRRSVASRNGTLLGSQRIDTQAPLILYSNQKVLALDLLSIHLIRNINGSTIISYHPSLNIPTTSAPYLHERIRFAGQSVYWQSMFQTSPDPTLVLLCFIWHALYGWDEALESLYEHILSLENRVISTAHMPLTRELHVIRAHHLHYSSLLDDFKKNIDFIQETPTPFMTSTNYDEKLLTENERLLKRECKNLADEVARLKLMLHQQERRLKNVMNLVFSSVNITDSKYMREMTEAAVRDSAAMKQIAYLTMIFLPASFVAAVFGMNVAEINPGTLGTIPHYVAVAIPFTIFTIWVIIAFQSKYIFEGEVPFWLRLTWPFRLFYERYIKRKSKSSITDVDDEETEGEYKIGVVNSREEPILPSTTPSLPR